MKRIYSALILAVALGASAISTVHAAQYVNQQLHTRREIQEKQVPVGNNAMSKTCAQMHKEMLAKSDPTVK